MTSFCVSDITGYVLLICYHFMTNAILHKILAFPFDMRCELLRIHYNAIALCIIFHITTYITHACMQAHTDTHTLQTHMHTHTHVHAW